ncbi:hypothetical protein [Micromonospora sp. DT47]
MPAVDDPDDGEPFASPARDASASAEMSAWLLWNFDADQQLR